LQGRKNSTEKRVKMEKQERNVIFFKVRNLKRKKNQKKCKLNKKIGMNQITSGGKVIIRESIRHGQ